VNDEDRRLRQSFTRLRDEDRESAPSFDHILHRERRRPPALRPRLAAIRVTMAAAAVVLLILTVPPLVERIRPDPEAGRLAAEIQRTSTVWRSPTDFLLERRPPPWRGVPAIGRPAVRTGTAVGSPEPREDGTDSEDPGPKNPGRNRS
jgi:hypothetical protein